jgi:hypothetical protein
LVPQVWTPVPMHWTFPGTHTPVQAPVTQAWLTQATGSAQLPFDWQVWTPLPEHWCAPGVQVPPHWPLVQTLEHWTEAPQLPVASQVCTPVPAESHWVDCGAQEPTQVPPTHAWFVQAEPVPHAPLALHVWTLLPVAEHWVELGLQVPVHTPWTHAWLPQSWAAPHWPLALHV